MLSEQRCHKPGAGTKQGAAQLCAPGRAADHPSRTSEHAPQAAVSVHVLNPQSISVAELYGRYNAVTGEWVDGLASHLFRDPRAPHGGATAAGSALPPRTWVVFDGPVTSERVESMNTALDDSRLLCLPNGERIKLDDARLRLLFETEDLAMASPATVSRCVVGGRGQ
jgi:dynein heavy chain